MEYVNCFCQMFQDFSFLKFGAILKKSDGKRFEYLGQDNSHSIYPLPLSMEFLEQSNQKTMRFNWRKICKEKY